jgi:hypothetical protein
MYGLLAIPVLIQMFRYLDTAMARHGYRKQYYAVHVVHNLGIVALTLPDVYRSFFYLHTATQMPLNWPAIYLCVALHAYHIIDYWDTLRYDDWLHHGLMIGIAIPLGLVVPAGALFGCNLFFTTGLPGAITYSFLFSERNGIVPKRDTQQANATINLWIRAPGCVAQAALVAATALSASDESVIQRMAALIIASLTAWNGLYFMNQAVRVNAITQHTASA